MNEFLELETRRKIYDLVSRNPGLHLSKIAELLNMRISLVEYHLIYLEKHKIIKSVNEGGYSRFYIEGSIGSSEKKIISLLRQEIPLKIVLYLLKNDNSKHKEILKIFDISPSTLSYHLKKLVDNKVIYFNYEDKNKGYSITNKDEIIKLILQYKPYNVIDGFTDLWSDLLI